MRAAVGLTTAKWRTGLQSKSIFRYPVKGLSPEPLARTQLAKGQTLPADRLYAIENGPSGFDPAAPGYLPKSRFLMLMRNERLARLRTQFDEASHTLRIEADGQEAASGDLRTSEGRAAIERFFAAFCAAELRGPPKVLPRPDHSFSDVAKKVVSIINLASVAARRDRYRRGRSSAALPRQRLRRRLAGVARVRTAWAGNSHRAGRPAEDRQADRALRGDQRRSRDRHSRLGHPAHPDADVRACRLRGLRRGGRRRSDRGGR